MSEILRHRTETPVHAGLIDVMEWLPASTARAGSFQPGVLDVSWFRRAEYQLVLAHGGQDIKTESTFCDAGPLFAGAENAIASARAVARHYCVDAASTLRVEVRLSVTDEPNLAQPAPHYSGFTHWAPIPAHVYRRDLPRAAQWLECDPDARILAGGFALLGPIASISLVDAQCIWSSSEGRTDMRQALFAEVRARAWCFPDLASMPERVSA